MTKNNRDNKRSRDRRKLREKLFYRQEGKCLACRCPMVLPSDVIGRKVFLDSMACMVRRNLPEPGKPDTDPRNKLMIVACVKCVAERDRAHQLKIPLQDRQLASGRMPLSVPPDGTLPDLLSPPKPIG